MVYENPSIESSYRENDLGRTLYDLVLDLKPKKIIEFGALGGYSTICMAMALDELGRGKIYSYDLWGKYPFKHSTMSEAARNARAYDLERYIEFLYGDFYTWDPEPFDLMHVDISNDGDVIEHADTYYSHYGPIVFEGGTYSRDNVGWMKKYHKRPIKGSADYEILNDKFPSLSIL